MGFNEGPKNYFKVQSAIGTLKVRGKINSREISALVQAIPVDITNYAGEMKCVTPSESKSVTGSGPRPIVYERNSFAGEVCRGCKALPHCILKLISDDAINLSRLPREIALMQEF